MVVRLSKVAREFNVGLSTIVDFLNDKGIKISSDPNAKLTEENYALIAKEFSTDSEAKKESTKVDLKNTRKKKETVSIDDTAASQDQDSEDEFISVKDEIRLENHIKVVDHIDLNRINKPKQEEKPVPAPVQPEVVQEKIQEKQVIETPAPVVREVAEEVAPIVAEAETEPEAAAEDHYRPSRPTIKDVKVVGTIDLDSINQRTRPAKKTKLEKERDKKELTRARVTPAAVATGNGETTEASSDADDEAKKKRKRITRKDEKIVVDAATASTFPKTVTTKVEEGSKKLKKLKKKKTEKSEITDEDVDKQIKDTFARLGSKGKSKASKHRREIGRAHV